MAFFWILALIYGSGLRGSEVARLKISDIDTPWFTINPVGIDIVQCVRELIRKFGWTKEKRILNVKGSVTYRKI